MARYYFFLSTAGRLVQDDAGEEFSTQEQARAHAGQVASELARNLSGPPASCHLIVFDEIGRVVFNVSVLNGDTG
jgi:hypothetical protein